jgi:hypothetical protein
MIEQFKVLARSGVDVGGSGTRCAMLLIVGQAIGVGVTLWRSEVKGENSWKQQKIV